MRIGCRWAAVVVIIFSTRSLAAEMTKPDVWVDRAVAEARRMVEDDQRSLHAVLAMVMQARGSDADRAFLREAAAAMERASATLPPSERLARLLVAADAAAMA